MYSSPAVAGGLVYVGSTDHRVYALNASTGAMVWSYRTGGDVYSSSAVSQGVVYIGSYDGEVYAFGFPNETSKSSYAENALFAVFYTVAALAITVLAVVAWRRKRKGEPMISRKQKNGLDSVSALFKISLFPLYSQHDTFQRPL